MKSDAHNALNELLEDLIEMNAYELVQDISTVISRGETVEVKTGGREKEFSQRPFDPSEAYHIAISMLIASLEALLIEKEIKHNLNELIDTQTSIYWSKDFVEENPTELENAILDRLPELDDKELRLFEEDIKNLFNLNKEYKNAYSQRS